LHFWFTELSLFEENFLTVCHILPRRKEHYLYFCLCVSERKRRNEL